MKAKHSAQIWLIAMAIAACCVVVCVQGVSAATIYDTAVSYWDLDNDADDSRPAGNDGDIYGATPTTGKVGGAYGFDGQNDYISMGDVLDMGQNQNFTLSFWVKDTKNANPGALINKFNSTNPGWGVFSWGGTLQFKVHSSDYIDDFMNYAPPETNTWIHIVCLRSGSTGIIYKDGILKNTETLNSGNTSNSQPLQIGKRSDSANWYFNGTVDEVAVWNTALNSDQIDALYKAGLIADAVGSSGLGLGYSTDQINQIMDLYYEGKIGNNPDPLEIGEKTWNYYEDDPAWAPQDLEIGEYWTNGSAYYIKLGSGTGDPGVPEPATVVGLLLTVIVGGLGRLRKASFKL